MLALKNVTQQYGKNRVLAGASLSIGPNDCVCIVGDGGSGKSTILKLLVRAEDPASGTVEVDGIPLLKVPPAVLQLYRRRLGIAFQEPSLLMQSTIAENIALPLEMANVPQDVIVKTVTDLIARLGLQSCATRIAEDCSMSERALAGIARAAVTSPMIVLADEPLQHLDATQAKLVVALFAAMRKRGMTLVLFSRNPQTASVFDARVLALKNGTTTSSTAQRSTVSPATTHRILEETEGKLHAVMDAKPARKVGQPKNDKKIRITSIGSGL
jgi:ABC-type ATPase involved in cell division